jgi:cell shape-determining protein MreD
MLFNLLVLIATVCTFAVQEFIPPIEIANMATLFLPAVFFMCASVAVPFMMMLVLAFLTGVIWDARYLPPAAMDVLQQPESLSLLGSSSADTSLGGGNLAFGISILLFGLLGALMQGVRPLFKRGRLELPVLMVGAGTFFWLFAQYLLITFMRGSFNFPSGVWSKMVTDTLLGMLVAPLIFLALHWIARLSSYEIKYEGLRYNFDGR